MKFFGKDVTQNIKKRSYFGDMLSAGPGLDLVIV